MINVGKPIPAPHVVHLGDLEPPSAPQGLLAEARDFRDKKKALPGASTVPAVQFCVLKKYPSSHNHGSESTVATFQCWIHNPVENPYFDSYHGSVKNRCISNWIVS